MAWRRQFDIAAASLEGDPAPLNLCCPHQFVFFVTAPVIATAAQWKSYRAPLSPAKNSMSASSSERRPCVSFTVIGSGFDSAA
jgi:hypothetical protein